MGEIDEAGPVRRVIQHPANWVAAPWAVTCGVVVGVGLSVHWQDASRWALAVLLSLLICGIIWEGITRADWRSVRDDWRKAGHVPVMTIRVPYLAASAPLRNAAAAWSGLAWWWRESLWPLAGDAVLTMALLTPLALVVAGGIGRGALWVCATMVVYAFVAGTSAPTSSKRIWSAPLVLGGSWLLGQASVHHLTPFGALGAGLATLAFLGLERVLRGSGFLVPDLAGVALVAVLGWQRATVAATVAGALLLMAVAARSGSAPREGLVRWARPLWLGALLVAAFGIAGL